MSTVREETDRKFELLDRYRALRLDEMVEDLRTLAEEEAERGRYPWKSEFRSRDEIIELYARRRAYNRRYLLDLALLLIMFAVLLYAGSTVVRMISP